MNRSFFLLICSALSFVFGCILFMLPRFASQLLGLTIDIETLSVIRGMGGLIIGNGFTNLLLRKSLDVPIIKSVLIINMITHLLGLLADAWGIYDGALSFIQIIPVELTHLFIGSGSLFYYLQLGSSKNNND